MKRQVLLVRGSVHPFYQEILSVASSSNRYLTGMLPTKPTFLQSSLVPLGSVRACETMAWLKFSLIQQTLLLTHWLWAGQGLIPGAEQDQFLPSAI